VRPSGLGAADRLAGRARVVGGDLAWVTCTENILSETDGRVGVTAILATNLFERAGNGWRMIHHHGSHVLGHPAQ
jgi:ketosteroid isomerase-like protein